MPAPALSSRFFDGPRLAPADRSGSPHLISWLPPTPQTNTEPFDLYVECADNPAEALTAGVPSAHLFLLGHLDRDRLGRRTGAESLLRLAVEPGGAVDVSATEVIPPRALSELLRHTDVYLLPAAWLNRCQVVSVFQVGPAGDVVEGPRLRDPQPVLLRCADAGHGLPGLPADSVRWPSRSMRATVTRYATAAEDDPPGLPWLRLLRRRPTPQPGLRLLELRVARRAAIDVTATARMLAPLTSVRSGAGALLADGVQTVLPASAYARTRIRREFHAVDGRWRRAPTTRRIILSDWTPLPIPGGGS